MKGYKDANGDLRLFRPMENMKRFETSCERLSLPKFDKNELLLCMEDFVKVEKEWIPANEGSSLYLRPFAFGTDEELGVKPSSAAKLMIVACPVGPYFSTGVKPIKLAVVRDYERGNPRSAAAYKLGANYGPTCSISSELVSRGYNQALWTHNDNILEVGACNIFFLVKNKNGKTECITPPLDGSVLPGITRKSIVELIEKEHPNVDMVVRDYTVTELVESFNENRVIEVFGAGTAVTILPVQELCK
jgi:branched-chain amino acid aminotransferase